MAISLPTPPLVVQISFGAASQEACPDKECRELIPSSQDRVCLGFSQSY